MNDPGHIWHVYNKEIGDMYGYYCSIDSWIDEQYPMFLIDWKKEQYQIGLKIDWNTVQTLWREYEFTSEHSPEDALWELLDIVVNDLAQYERNTKESEPQVIDEGKIRLFVSARAMTEAQEKFRAEIERNIT